MYVYAFAYVYAYAFRKYFKGVEVKKLKQNSYLYPITIAVYMYLPYMLSNTQRHVKSGKYKFP